VLRTGLVEPEFNPSRHKDFLKFDREELLPSVSLNALDRKWHLFGDPLEESNGVGCRVPFK